MLAPLLFLMAVCIILPITLWNIFHYIIARRSGWLKIVEVYPPKKISGDKQVFFLRRLFMRPTIYPVTVYTDQDGVTFVKNPSFALNNLFIPRRIYIPWNEINGMQSEYYTSSLLRYLIELRFAQVPKLPLFIDEQLAMELRDASNGRWAYKEKVVS